MHLQPVLLSFLATTTVHAAHPDKLEWRACGSNEKCGDLEFCQGGQAAYGYRAVGDVGTPCGSKIGPIIRMKKGQVYKLVLHNAASAPTNIHTHGLHIVGDGDGDDITRVADGRSCLSYTWDIAADHPSGTYWYHPHYHGKTNEQVSGGAFGMIIIEDGNNEVNEWAHEENERLLLVYSSGLGRDQDVPSKLLANGVRHETFYVLPDHWYRFRMAIVVPDAEPDRITFGTLCTVYKVASDGVWHSAALVAYQGSSFELTGASRADFAIKCSSGSSTIQWGSSAVATIDANAEYDWSGGVAASGDDTLDLGDAPTRPPSLEDLSSSSVVNSNRFTVGLEKDSIRLNASTYSGMSGLGDINFNEVFELTIRDSHRHPFHLHLYHMQILTPGGCGGHTEGEYYDTISATRDQPCTVRFKTADFGQKMVLHCHELEHEDDGAINFFNVVNVPESKQNIVDSPAYTCPTLTEDEMTHPSSLAGTATAGPATTDPTTTGPATTDPATTGPATTAVTTTTDATTTTSKRPLHPTWGTTTTTTEADTTTTTAETTTKATTTTTTTEATTAARTTKAAETTTEATTTAATTTTETTTTTTKRPLPPTWGTASTTTAADTTTTAVETTTEATTTTTTDAAQTTTTTETTTTEEPTEPTEPTTSATTTTETTTTTDTATAEKETPSPTPMVFTESGTPSPSLSCNVSFCIEDSDCCSGSCQQYGRCSDSDTLTSRAWTWDRAHVSQLMRFCFITGCLLSVIELII